MKAKSFSPEVSTSETQKVDIRPLQPVTVCLIVALLLVVSTMIAYQPTLFNFFNSDDFLMLSWLKSAAKNPVMIVQALGKPWIFPMYYRPLVNLALAAEFAIWGANGLWFRFGNVVGLLLTSLLLGMLVFSFSGKIGRNCLSSQVRIFWSLLSAALFALYPLHCEPVNWVIDRLEILAGVFWLLSFWCYMQWRECSTKWYLFASLASFILALLSKELAIVLPLLFLSYELLCLDSPIGILGGMPGEMPGEMPKEMPKRNRTKNIAELVSQCLHKFTSAAFTTMPYWLVLAVYFVWRKIVLGTFIGGWDPSVSFYTGGASMLREWLHSVHQMLVPLNAHMMANCTPLPVSWQVMLILILAASCYAFRLVGNQKLAIFFLLWMALSIIPVYRFFIIDPNLLNARFAYIATIPLSAFLTYGVANLSFGFRYSNWVRTACGAFLALSFLILHINNLAFASAGHLSNRIVSQLRKYYQSTGGDPPVKLLGLPLISNGAYVCMNSISGMTKTPFQDRDIYNCTPLENGDQSFPLGFLKETINNNQSVLRFLYWDTNEETFKPISFNSPHPALNRDWQGMSLPSILHVVPNSSTKLTWEGNGIAHIVSNKRPELDIDISGLDCWTTDFMCLKIRQRPSQVNGHKAFSQAVLRYTNDIVTTFSWRCCSCALIDTTKPEQTLIFPMRALPDWIFGGHCRQLKLILPAHCDLSIVSLSTPAAKTIIPLISLAKVSPIKNFDTENGIVSLNGHLSRQLIHYDASGIQGCSHVVLDVIGPHTDFACLYSTQTAEPVLFSLNAYGCTGNIEIDRSSFPADKGLYKARLRAINLSKDQVSLAGDHFVIAVN